MRIALKVLSSVPHCSSPAASNLSASWIAASPSTSGFSSLLAYIEQFKNNRLKISIRYRFYFQQEQ